MKFLTIVNEAVQWKKKRMCESVEWICKSVEGMIKN